MFAIIKTGGKQYRVAENQVLHVERLDGAPGETVAFEHVLAVGGDEISLGTPFVPNAKVTGEIVAQERASKVIVFKKRRRQNSKRRNGHRQLLTAVRISRIEFGEANEGVPATEVKDTKADGPEGGETEAVATN